MPKFDEAQDYRNLIGMLIKRDSVLNMPIADPQAEIRFLRAHLEGTNIMLSNIYDKYSPKEANAQPGK